MKKTNRFITIGTILSAMMAFVFILANSADAVTTPALDSASPVSAERIPGHFLTGPNDGAALDIALAYINANTADLGLTSADVSDMVVRDHYTSQHNGVTHIYFNQMLNGIQVYNAIMNINIARDGSVINLGNRFVPDVANAVVANDASLSAPEAVAAVAGQLGLDLAGEPAVQDIVGGPAQKAILDNAGISLDAIPVQLMYTPTDNGVSLTWDMTIYELSTLHWWTIRADAVTGEILSQHDYVVHENQGHEGDIPGSSIAYESGSAPQSQSGSAAPAESVPESYRVFAYPLEYPSDGPDTLELNPFDITSNPWGWHDTNNAAGPEFTTTQGNNVHADSDLDANNSPDGNAPDAGAPLVFDYAFDLSMDPSVYLTGSIVNLFYWNNIMHDINYRYGFDEASGNFQENNYGNGGVGSDYVHADAQDGSGTDNANFATPPDGLNPRMQMYRTTYPFGQAITVTAPVSITGIYTANASANGGTANGLSADVELVIDGTAPNNDACEPLTNDLTGKIALIIWNQGACNSSQFVLNAANAGAVAAIMIDNTVLPLTNFGGSASIPSVAVGINDGQLLLDELANANTVTVTIGDNPQPGVDRDTDLDNGVIAHEYGHGVSNRLTGGPSASTCLSNQEQMGEGWSDLQTLFIHAVPSDMATDARGIGIWSLGAGYQGIRNFPYSTDMNVNPQTYVNIGSTNLPHGLGEIWASAVWEVYWNLVDKHGFNANIYDDWTTGGNNLTFQLVNDGMKFQPCRPGFVDGRDGILAADMALTAGANQCEIWEGFAKRGVGFSADQGTGNLVGDETEAFDLPPTCEADVTVSGEGGPNPVTEGLPVTYTFEVSNTGAFSATNVTFTGTLDSNTTYVLDNTTVGSCSESSGVVTCDLGQMDPNDLATITIVAMTTTPGDVTATAEVSADENENISNNTASVTITVDPIAPDMWYIYMPAVFND